MQPTQDLLLSLPVHLKTKQEIDALKEQVNFIHIAEYYDLLPEEQRVEHEAGCDENGRYVLDTNQHIPKHSVVKIKPNDFQAAKDLAAAIRVAEEQKSILHREYQNYRLWDTKQLTSMDKLNDAMQVIMKKYKITRVDRIDYNTGEIFTYADQEITDGEGDTVPEESETAQDS